jgi:hypothetical protein
MIKEENLILKKISTKSCTKQKIYQNTYEMFQQLKQCSRELANEINKDLLKHKINLPFEFTDKGEFIAELKFAGDMLIMTMHTNIFEFPRDHGIMKTSYVMEDSLRSYCGVILIYNFLSDSFKYNRKDDVGYLVARIFINKEFHYFVEGKKQIGFLYNNFINDTIDKDAIKRILDSAVNYCIDFDLLTPNYDNIKEATVGEMQENTLNMNIKTGKRLGFRFEADQNEVGS